MLVLVFGLVLVIVLAISIIWGNKDRWDSVGSILGVILSATGIIALIVVSIVLPLDRLGKAAELEAFYDANLQNYAMTVQETQGVLTISLEKLEGVLIPIEGSIEKLDVGKAVSDRIVEWRDAVNSYNSNLKKFRAYDANLWIGIYYPTLRQDMKPILIQ